MTSEHSSTGFHSDVANLLLGLSSDPPYPSEFNVQQRTDPFAIQRSRIPFHLAGYVRDTPPVVLNTTVSRQWHMRHDSIFKRTRDIDNILPASYVRDTSGSEK